MIVDAVFVANVFVFSLIGVLIGVVVAKQMQNKKPKETKE